jgi:hypothetical protein
LLLFLQTKIETINNQRMKNADMPAFPVQVTWTDDGKVVPLRTGEYSGFTAGLSKREEIASRAMQGLLSAGSNEHNANNIGLPDQNMVAREAVGYADALLKQLES